jgi:hypothetical protein
LNGAIGIIKKVVPEALDLLIKRRNRCAEKEMWSVPYFLFVPEALDLLIKRRNRCAEKEMWSVPYFLFLQHNRKTTRLDKRF